MDHGIRGRKFGRRSGPRKALLRGLAKALIQCECIKTTLPKAKDIRPFVEKMVTLGKKETLHNRRILISMLGGDITIASKIFELGKRYIERPGGYLRILKTGFRKGDGAPMSVIEFV